MSLALRIKRRILFGVFFAMTVLIYFFSSYLFVAQVATGIAALGLFYLVDHLYNIKFPLRHYVFAIIIVVSSLILSPLYFVYAHYDKILHLALPFLFSAIVFKLVSRLKLDTRWKLLFTFFVVVATLAFFEIGEFTLDYFFDVKTQGVYLRDSEGLTRFTQIIDRNTDTMIDLVFGAISAGIYWVWGGFSWIQGRRQLKRS